MNHVEQRKFYIQFGYHLFEIRELLLLFLVLYSTRVGNVRNVRIGRLVKLGSGLPLLLILLLLSISVNSVSIGFFVHRLALVGARIKASVGVGESSRRASVGCRALA